MPSPVVAQQIQAPEPMTAETNNLEVQQPKPITEMSTTDVSLRGGEYASCDCCGCGCSERCC